MPKNALRHELLTRRRNLSPAVWQTASEAAQKRLLELELFHRAACIALYAPIQHEVDTALLFAAARTADKKLLYPAVCGNDLQFREVTELRNLLTGSFGIAEPCATVPDHTIETADLIVVPGVAFDLQGHRVGFGRGYYDRCLSRYPRHGTLVGLCHDFQLLEQVPAEGHDIKMQYIITEKRLITP